MPRQVVRSVAIGVAVMVGIVLIVLANQQGLFGGGEGKQLLVKATRASNQGDYPQAQALLEEMLATFPDSRLADHGLFRLGQVHEAQEQLVEARAIYQTFLEKFPDSSLSGNVQDSLGDVNIMILFSPIVTDFDTVYVVRSGDTLGRIAATYGTTVEILKRANGVTGHMIYPQQKLKIPSGRFSIVVDKSQQRLLLTQENQFVRSYPVAIGRDDSTPEGTFKIVNRVPDPVWYRQGAVVPPESPDNILGSRWLGFNKRGYGIHGSVDPSPITEQETAGCVRMANQDIEELFAIIRIGTDVTIVN